MALPGAFGGGPHTSVGAPTTGAPQGATMRDIEGTLYEQYGPDGASLWRPYGLQEPYETVLWMDQLTGFNDLIVTTDSTLEYSSSAGALRRAALTGDVTASAGSNTTAIAADAVTFAKMQNIATDSLIGRDTASSGDPENILLNSTLSMDGAGNLQRAALTGNVTAPAGSNTTTIAAGVVTEAMQVLADNTTGDVTSTKHGYAPKSPGAATKYLNGATTPAWVQIAVPFTLHMNGGGSIVMTNQASGAGFLSSNARNVHLLDLTPYTQAKLDMRVTVASASANTPQVRVRYATSISSPPVVGDFAAMGTGATEIAASMAAIGVGISSGWVTITTGALTAATYIDVEQIGGDGAADPEVAGIVLWLR